ncbi:MAG: hypothetical protein ACPKQO_08480 [Nitrososphaeraceae archaeon]
MSRSKSLISCTLLFSTTIIFLLLVPTTASNTAPLSNMITIANAEYEYDEDYENNVYYYGNDGYPCVSCPEQSLTVEDIELINKLIIESGKSIAFVPIKNGFMLVDNGVNGNSNEKEIIFTGVGIVEPKPIMNIVTGFLHD